MRERNGLIRSGRIDVNEGRRLNIDGERCDRTEARSGPAVRVAAQILKPPPADAVDADQGILDPEERIERQLRNLQSLLAWKEGNGVDADDSCIESLIRQRIAIDDNRTGTIEEDRPRERAFMVPGLAVEDRPRHDQLPQHPALDRREQVSGIDILGPERPGRHIRVDEHVEIALIDRGVEKTDRARLLAAGREEQQGCKAQAPHPFHHMYSLVKHGIQSNKSFPRLQRQQLPQTGETVRRSRYRTTMYGVPQNSFVNGSSLT